MSVGEQARDEMYRQETALAWSLTGQLRGSLWTGGRCKHGFPLYIEHGGKLPGGGFWTCEGDRTVMHEFDSTEERITYEARRDLEACDPAGDRDRGDRLVRGRALMRGHWLRGSTRADWMGGLGVVLALLAGLCIALVCFG